MITNHFIAGFPPSSVLYCVLPAKGVTRMAKITIEELYHGEKYDIMSAVIAKALMFGIDERIEKGRTWIEMELVCQTLIAVEKMKKTVIVLPSRTR